MTNIEFVRSHYPHAQVIYSTGNAEGLPAGFKCYDRGVNGTLWTALSGTCSEKETAWAAAAFAIRAKAVMA